MDKGNHQVNQFGICQKERQPQLQLVSQQETRGAENSPRMLHHTHLPIWPEQLKHTS